MPIYEFECAKCHKEFEDLVLGADSNVHCPVCKSNEVKKAHVPGRLQVQRIVCFDRVLG